MYAACLKPGFASYLSLRHVREYPVICNATHITYGHKDMWLIRRPMMLNRIRFLIVSTIALLLIVNTSLAHVSAQNVPLWSAYFYQSDEEVNRVRQMFSGQTLVFSWRNGGVMYGTRIREVIRFCTTGEYQLSGHSERGTTMGNTQYSNWQEYGSWEVTTYQGNIFLAFQPDRGNTYYFRLNVYAGGRIGVANVSVQQQSSAQC
jgi:hypothetical protein